jgi:hypothetical protein
MKPIPLAMPGNPFASRKEPRVATEATHTYLSAPGEAHQAGDQPGCNEALLKVVDAFGNDTTKTVEVRIG